MQIFNIYMYLYHTLLLLLIKLFLLLFCGFNFAQKNYIHKFEITDIYNKYFIFVIAHTKYH